MTPAHDNSNGFCNRRWLEYAGFVGFILLLATAMFRLPAAMDTEYYSAYRTALYETLRLGSPWGISLVTTDGPLAAVQDPMYAGGSIWMALVWQFGGNLFLATVLVRGAYTLAWPRRWWALISLGFVLARVPQLAPWLVIVLLGWALIRQQGTDPAKAGLFAAIMAFLGLTSLGHLLTGLIAVTITAIVARCLVGRLLPVAGFALGTVGGWLTLGQTMTSLLAWITAAGGGLVSTSTLLRPGDPFAGLGILASCSAVALLFVAGRFCLRSEETRRDFGATCIFLTAAALISWKTIALQPFGLPGTYFVTLVIGAFLLLHAGDRLLSSGLLAVIAAAGLVRWQPLVLVDGLGHLNRQILVNVRGFASVPDLRSTLRTQIRQQGDQAYFLPRIRSAVATRTIMVMGASPVHALFNGLALVPRPAPVNELVRSPAIAELNRQSLTGPSAPDFVLQRMQPEHSWLPTQTDGPALLALYQSYEVVLEESGFFLWGRRKEIEPIRRTLVSEGTLVNGAGLDLPSSGEPYWLELDLQQSLGSALASLFWDPPTVGLVVRDTEGQAFYYAVLADTAISGFLISPLIHGDPDILYLQTGGHLPDVTQVSIATQPRNGHGVNYRLFSLPGLNLSPVRPTVPANALDRFQLFSQRPISNSFLIPIDVLPDESGSMIAFAHPPSTIEFAVRGTERSISAEFGILAGAYRDKNATDGVNFSIEFTDAEGSHQILAQRHLDPMADTADRGRQRFESLLPAGVAGRLILRTYNPANRTPAWDWAYWGQVTIKD